MTAQNRQTHIGPKRTWFDITGEAVWWSYCDGGMIAYTATERIVYDQTAEDIYAPWYARSITAEELAYAKRRATP